MPEDYLQVLDLIQNRHVNVQQRSDDVFVHPCVLPQTTPEQFIGFEIEPVVISTFICNIRLIILLVWV